jgi:hypothetical protein
VWPDGHPERVRLALALLLVLVGFVLNPVWYLWVGWWFTRNPATAAAGR